jgi:hypothetical protein
MISTHAEQDYADLIAASPAVGFLAKAALSASAIRELLDRHRGPGPAERPGGPGLAGRYSGPGPVEPVSGPRGR